MYRVPALHDVEHAQRIDGQHLHAALGVVVEDRGKVGRDGGDIRGPLRQGGRHLIGGGRNSKMIDVTRGNYILVFLFQLVSEFFDRFTIGHHLDHAHGGRAFQGHNIDIKRIHRFLRGPWLRHLGGRTARTGRFRGAGIPGGGAARQQRGGQGQDAEQREQFFHTVFPFNLFLILCLRDDRAVLPAKDDLQP